MALTIWNLAWNVTNQCNLKCVHCYADAGQALKGELSFDQAKEFLINPAKKIGTKFITLTGGEPLIRKDILNIMEYIGNSDIGISLASNGMLLNKENISIFKELKVKRIQISLEGHNAEINDKVRGKGTFDYLTGYVIPALVKNGLFTAVSLTPTNNNKLYMEQMVELCIKLGVRSFSVRRFVSEGRAVKNNLCKEIRRRDNYIFLKEISRLKNIYSKKIKILTGDPLYTIVDMQTARHKDSMVIGGCSAGIASVAIDSIGNIKPCTRINYNIGNILKDDLYNVWHENEVLLKLRSREKFLDKCARCGYIRICGGCRASAYKISGNMFSGDPNCWIGG